MLVAGGLRAGSASASGGPWAPRAGRAAQARGAKARQVARDPQPETCAGGHCQHGSDPGMIVKRENAAAAGEVGCGLFLAGRSPGPGPDDPRERRSRARRSSNAVAYGMGDDTREQRNIQDARGAAG
jgi:hypothetical protein